MQYAFLAHLSQRFKWAFLIKICPLFVVVVVVIVVINFSHFNLLLQNHWTNIYQTWHKASLGAGDSYLFKWMASPFSSGDNYEIVKIHWRNFEIFFSITTQVSLNEGPQPFSRGDNYEIGKIHWRNLKIFISRTTGPISTELGTKHLWVKGI